MAKKYIDAELLRKEIESRMGDCDANSKNPNQLLWAELAALIPLIDSLQQEQPCDSCINDKGCVTCKDGELWEGKEQPSEDLTAEIEKYFQGLWPGMETAEQCNTDMHFTPLAIMRLARHFYILGLKNNIPVTQITLDELAKEEEPVTEDLEEAAENYIAPIENDEGLDYINFSGRDIRDAFKAGAEWQAERLLKGSPMPEDTVIFQKGIEEGKRLMIEDAVEGYVNYYEDSGGILMAEAQVGCPYHNGDKVKIVIVKED